MQEGSSGYPKSHRVQILLCSLRVLCLLRFLGFLALQNLPALHLQVLPAFLQENFPVFVFILPFGL